MTSGTDAVTAIREEIQSGYGDATQTVLDSRVASAIVKRLRDMGWAAPDEVRALIACAGGRIVLDERTMMDPPGTMYMTEDPATMTRSVFVR